MKHKMALANTIYFGGLAILIYWAVWRVLHWPTPLPNEPTLYIGVALMFTAWLIRPYNDTPQLKGGRE